MKWIESATREFKREVTEAIKKEVIGFANTSGGEIFIGIDDDGAIIGLENAHQSLDQVANMLHDGVRPDILAHTFLDIIQLEEKEIIHITISRGTRRPYHLSGKGLKPSAVFIRYGTSVGNASEEAIRQMLIESDGTNFETIRSLHQDLTFQSATTILDKLKIKFGSEQQRTLHLITEDGYYTNLALLLSDQCEHTIKCARYKGTTKLEFQDRKEFSGSILKQVEDVYEYLSLYNATSSTFEGLQRVEQHEFPTYAIREALINAVVHRDYSFSSSILIHLFTDRIELVSVGGLVRGLTVQDIELGISQSRNPRLANVFYQMKWIESYGTGLQRMKESYENALVGPSWIVSENAFVVTLPKQQLAQKEEQAVLMESWLATHNTFTTKELAQYLNKSKATVRNMIEDLINAHRIIRVGNGPSTKYHVLK